MLVKLFDNLDAKGYNTTTARTKLAEMDTKVEALKLEVTKAITDLEAIKSTPCTDQKTMQKQFQGVHDSIKTVYTKEHEIVKFYKEQVHTVVSALRNQKNLTPKPTKVAKPAKNLTPEPTEVVGD
jgi:hypothetical protein